MKKFFLFTLVLCLFLTACGGTAEPVETAPATTEPMAQAAVAPTEEPTEAPTEDPNAYTAYTLGADENYVDVVWAKGFWEVDMEECIEQAEFYGATGAQATPLSLELNQNGFRMEVDYTGYDIDSNKVIPYGTVKLIGAKAEGLANISGINPKDYQGMGSYDYTDPNGVKSEFGSLPEGNGQTDAYFYYNENAKGEWCDITYVVMCYYELTNNLYNVVYRVDNENDMRVDPSLLTADSLFRPAVQTLSYGDFTFEMSQFAIQCGGELYVYNYRPGMSFSDWACSELNTDGWIPWYGDSVLSPDRTYVGNWGYDDMQEIMRLYGRENLLIAEEYDGKINRLNNRYTTQVVSGTDLSGMDVGGVTIISGEQFLEQNGLDGMSIEELQEFLSTANLDDFDMTGISQAESAGSISADGDVFIDVTEEDEIAELGNISISVAHMVNAHTPLFTPGFRIVSKEDGRVAYRSTGMGDGLYLLDDTLDIYMNGIADELIPHIKLYAFPESEEFMATLEGHTILNVHPTPLEQGDAMLTIPEDAVCLTFQRVADGQEAPNTPSSLVIPNDELHGNQNKDAVYARYMTKDDPNFGEGVNLVFAITFDDELVYWIHMGSNFNETVEVTRASNQMP